MRLPEHRQLETGVTRQHQGEIASRWTRSRIDVLWLVAVLPPLAGVVAVDAGALLLNLLVVMITLQSWHSVFEYCLVEDTCLQPSRFVSACQWLQGILFVLLLPLDISLWQLVLAVSFGTVFGEQLFGGRGFSFLNPVVTGLAFYLFSFSLNLDEAAIAMIAHWGLLVPGIVGLLLFELISLRTVAGILVGTATVLLLNSNAMIDLQLLLGSNAAWLALLFLACDPGCGGSSNPARWMHGVLLGALVLTLAGTSPGQLSAIVFAILLASLSAPLIDHVVMALYAHRRRRHMLHRRADHG